MPQRVVAQLDANPYVSRDTGTCMRHVHQDAGTVIARVHGEVRSGCSHGLNLAMRFDVQPADSSVGADRQHQSHDGAQGDDGCPQNFWSQASGAVAADPASEK